MNNGLPPTDLKARTGELTPPGKSSVAFLYNCRDLFMFILFPITAMLYFFAGIILISANYFNIIKKY